MDNKTNTCVLVGIGAAGRILLGRFLPVLFANVNGIAQGAAGRDPFAGLIREHRLTETGDSSERAMAGRLCALRSEIEPHAREKKRHSFHACESCWTSGEPLNWAARSGR